MKKIKYHNLREYVPVVIGIVLLAVLGIILVFFINYENPSKILEVPEKEVSAKYKEKKVDISSSTCPKVNISKYKEMADELKTDYQFHEVETGLDVEYDTIFNKDAVKDTTIVPFIYISNLKEGLYLTIESEQDPDSFYKITLEDFEEENVSYICPYSEQSLIYTIKIYVDVDDCHDVMIRKFTMQLPVYNKYQNQARCSRYPDFKYCAEYLMEDLPSYTVYDYEFSKYIKDVERGKVTTSPTTDVLKNIAGIGVDENDEEFQKLLKELEAEEEKQKKEESKKEKSNNYIIVGTIIITILVIIGLWIIIKKRGKRK